MMFKKLAASAVLLGLASAQVTSDCNPYQGATCDPNPAFGTEYNWYFNSTPDSDLWATTVGSINYTDDQGAEFTINEQGDSPTLRTTFYVFFGKFEFHLKAASGKGIVSSMMLLSDDLDEIDWEFIGTNSSASTNFYGKGIEEFTNGAWHDVPTPVQDDYHNYTTHWTKHKIEFYIDNSLVRTVLPKDAVSENGTDIYPQTPMRMSLGIWAGGDPSLNYWTRKWAGGDTDYSKAPFDMHVKQVYIEDFSSGKEYIWKDDSGTMDSIEVVAGNSTAYKILHKEPEKSLNEKFNDLPQASKIAIYAGGSAVAAVLLGALIFYCIRQRRRGAAEARTALQSAEADRMEMNRYRKSGMINPDNFTEHGSEYNARDMKSGGAIVGDSYNIPNSSTSTLENEKAWGGAAAAGVGAGAIAGVGAAAALRSQTQSPRSPGPFHDSRGPGSPGPFHDSHASGSPGPFRDSHAPGSPGPFRDSDGPGSPRSMSSASFASPRSQSPMIRSPGSPGPQSAYGAHRMQPAGVPMSPSVRSFSGDQGFPVNRMASPGPSVMSASSRTYSGNYGPGRGSPGPGPNGYRQ